MVIIGHRGASGAAPENSITALKLAMQHGAAGVEFDLRMSRDGKIIVIHDPSTRRVSGVNLDVDQFDYSELSELNIAANKKGWVERLPLFEDVLTALPHGYLFIHLKTRGERMIKALVETLDAHTGAARRSWILSFSLDDLRRLKQLRPDLRAINLFARKNSDRALQYVREAGLDGIGLHRMMTNQLFLEQIKKENLLSYVWTINRDRRAWKMNKLGIDVMATDRPAHYVKLFGTDYLER